MTSIETSSFSGVSADIANTAAFIPEEPTHTLRYVYTTPEWHDNFIGWGDFLTSFVETTGLTARVGQGMAGGVVGQAMEYTAAVEVFAKPGSSVIVTIPEGLPKDGEWKLVIVSGDTSREIVVAEHEGEIVALDA